MSITLTALMKQRYDTAANWTAQNPTLLAGEFGIESDTKRWKVGTGATAWTSLLYSNGGTYPLVNADIAAAAAIVDTKLATIATAGKVSNSATTAASANTASAIVARDASGNFTAGTITAALTGAASANVLKAGDTMTGVLAVTAGTAALPGIAVSGDLNTGIYSPGADQLAISTGGTVKATVDSSGRLLVGVSANANGGILQLSGGITFPATAVAASDANTLDDYEEGSWTPTYAPSSGSFTTMTVNVQGARYVKIGQQVTVSAYFFTTAVDATGASGNISISGLPFTTRSTQVVRYGAVLGYTAGFNSKPIIAYIFNDSTSIELLESTTDNDFLDVADLNTTAGNKNFIYITATYFVN